MARYTYMPPTIESRNPKLCHWCNQRPVVVGLVTRGIQSCRECFDSDTNWEARVQKLEEEGLTRSDAQAVVDAEDQKAGRARKP